MMDKCNGCRFLVEMYDNTWFYCNKMMCEVKDIKGSCNE